MTSLWPLIKCKLRRKCKQKEKNKYYILTGTDSEKNGTDEHICRARIETQALRTDLWTQWGKERMGHIERVAVKPTHYRV